MAEPCLKFSTRSVRSLAEAGADATDVLVIGARVDDRGNKAVEELSKLSKATIQLGYDTDTNELIVDGTIQNLQTLKGMLRNRSLRVETTTLGMTEIIRVIQAARDVGTVDLEFTYLEPMRYTQIGLSGTYLNARDFSLTENRVFRAIHGFAHQQTGLKESYIFFVGYESSRLLQAFQQPEFEVSEEDKYVVFGVPAFVCGWETNALASHAADLRKLKFRNMHYCAANDVREAYLKLWEVYTRVGNEQRTTVVSPLGTKPHTLASALFLVETKGNSYPTALYYDHPQRKTGRSEDVRAWHFYRVRWR